MIYLLLNRRVRLAKCQSLFIINLSISDVFVSILGVFRGLGIIDSRFVGAVNNTATPYCTAYTLLSASISFSNVIALLPLTIDRAVAVIFPLRHGTIITNKTCAVMFGAGWLSIIILLIDSLVALKNDTDKTLYLVMYHSCVFTGKTHQIDFIFLLIIPFIIIVLIYVLMLFTIVKSNRSCGRFLVLSIAIIGTNIMCFTPTVIRIFVNKEMSYKATQILRDTFWYLNGIFNPLIYFLSHPKTRDYLRLNCALARILHKMRQSFSA